MNIRQSEVLDQLYNISETPRLITPATDKTVPDLIKYVDSRGLDDRHVHNIIFFANLLGVDDFMNGLGAIKDQSMYWLIGRFINALRNDSDQQIAKEVYDSVAVMREFIAGFKSPRKDINLLHLKAGYMEETPIYALHVQGAGPNDSIYPNYSKFAPDIHLILRFIEKSEHTRLVESGRIMRFFICAQATQRNELGNPDFCAEEFVNGFTLDKLCKAINNDNLTNSVLTIDDINDLLGRRDLYHRLLNAKKYREKPDELQLSIAKYEAAQRVPELKRANRLALEAVYPLEAPKRDLNANTIKSGLLSRAIEKKLKPVTLKQHNSFVDKIFGVLKPPVTRTTGYKRIVRTEYVHIDRVYVTEFDDDKKQWRGVRLEKKFVLPKEAAAEGEGIDDYPTEELILPPKSPFSSKRVHSEIPLSVLNRYNYTFFWDRGSLKLYEISRLYHYLFDKYAPAVDSIANAVIFIECGLLLGLGEDQILEIKIGKAKSSDDSITANNYDEQLKKKIQIFYSPDRRSISYSIPAAALGYYEETIVSENCLVSQTVFELRVPDSIAEALGEIITAYKDARKGLSSDLLFPKSVQAKCYTQMIGFLKSFNSDSGMNLSKESLKRSFKSYFQARYGFDPVCVSYIAVNLDPQTRTQRFYTRITPAMLHNEYYRCYNAFKTAVRENLIKIANNDERIVPSLSLQKLSMLGGAPGAHELETFYAFGSKVVPDLEKLRKFIRKIIGMLQSHSSLTPSDRRRYHNLYTIFAYIVVQLALGLRPIADPPVSIESIDSLGNYIFVRDKNSRRFEESRINFIAPIVRKILTSLAKGAGRTIDWLSSQKAINMEYYGRLFYFIGDDDIAIDVEPKSIRDVLKDNGLTDLYDYPLNCMRHLLSTTLREQRINSDLIDALLGHQRSGKEFLNTYSTSSVEALKMISEITGEILDELDIRPILYEY